MAMVILQVLGLVLESFALASLLVIHGFSESLPDAEGRSGDLYVEILPIIIPIITAPNAAPQPSGTGFQPPPFVSPSTSGPVPQTAKGQTSSPPADPPSTPPPNIFGPPPKAHQHYVPSIEPIPPPEQPQFVEPPPSMVHAPVPSTSPSHSSPPASQYVPPDSHKTLAPEYNAPLRPPSPISPASNRVAPESVPRNLPPSHSFSPEEPPALLPFPDVPSSPISLTIPPPTQLLSPVEYPARPPEKNVFPVSTPPPGLTAVPVAAPISQLPFEAPSASRLPGHSTGAPRPYSEPREDKITPAPLSHIMPPISRQRDPKANLRHTAPPPSTEVLPPSSSIDNHHSPISASSPTSQSSQAKISPRISPSGSTKSNPKTTPFPPMQELPPPPPHKACVPMTCTEPLTYGPQEFSCICVLPIQVGIRLSVSLYTFFPLVSVLAEEIAAGAYMKQSQVRIMGANADEYNLQKTITLIDLVPLKEAFDDTTAHLTFQRFWNKSVAINMALFGDYDILYVRYPGLPSSPPSPQSTVGVIGSKPYPSHDNDARTVQPLGVDVRGKHHKDGLRKGILASIVVSVFIIFILCCSIAWIFLLKRINRGYRSNSTPPTTHSLAKSSGRAVSIIGSGPCSPSFSLGSSMTAYTGSTRTFSSSDIGRATDHFNEAKILGEGGFGLVYSGVLEDETKVAVKILKRYDQQGDREFFSEVEMLSRLHHRNLVKLIGICVEDRIRCLVYELIPNGSVESHLHGMDKETGPLDWSARLKVALGAARALAYLHEDSSPRVIHRDFKASNILLEDDYTPKVSDFGLARTAMEEENTHVSTRVMGTFGYVAPEYAMTGHLLVKSDVYSYGVVLLELLTGKKPIDMSQPPGQENLVSWARPLLASKEGLMSIIDPFLGPDSPFDSIAKVAVVASMCVQPEVSHRPFMGEVVQALKLLCNECDEPKEINEHLLIDTEARRSTNSDRLRDTLLTQSSISDYNYMLHDDKDLSMSELLSSSVHFGREDSESFMRNSSSGPLRTGRTKRLWNTLRRLPGGSMSEHGMFLRLWPGSH